MKRREAKRREAMIREEKSREEKLQFRRQLTEWSDGSLQDQIPNGRVGGG